MRFIDEFLNNITMYRLVLYVLIAFAVVGFIFSVFGVLPFDALSYLFSFVFLLVVCYIANKIFAYVFSAPTNVESVYISALILGLILAPPKNLAEVAVLGWAGTLAVASKFIFAFGRKHIFNPVAIAVFLTGTFIYGSATWWVGTVAMLPAVLIGGFLIIRKIRRWDLTVSFLAISLLTTLTISALTGRNVVTEIWRSISDTALIFFVSIMLTEPLTSPPTKTLRLIYGAIVGILFAPQVHFGSLYLTPEIALVIGNIYSYIVSPKYKLLLTFKEKIKLAPDTYDFIFTTDKRIKFTPGQYMEFTFQHPKTDSRGNRRYLSIASSPTENDIRLGIKFADPPSSYKKNLFDLNQTQKVTAGQLIGDFVMPKDKSKKLVFIAGGIGITPYRSMLKYLIDTGEKRDIILIYSAKNKDEFVYEDVIDEAAQKLGVKVIYNATDIDGHMDANSIIKNIPDFKDRTFYISGSHAVVTSFESLLKELNISTSQIVTDYFPGFA